VSDPAAGPGTLIPNIRAVETALQRRMARPGGITAKEALARAEEGLALHRARALLVLREKVDALTALSEARAPGSEPEVYPLASALVDLAGYLEVPPFYAAAYGLCEIADRMAAAGIWSWPSVEVHARALSLILADDCREGEGTERLLAGLRAVADHAPRAG